jgi:hypothetical protein
MKQVLFTKLKHSLPLELKWEKTTGLVVVVVILTKLSA